MLSKKETKLCILMTETFQSTDHRIDVFEFWSMPDTQETHDIEPLLV